MREKVIVNLAREFHQQLREYKVKTDVQRQRAI